MNSAIGTAGPGQMRSEQAKRQKLNVLFFMSDDLRPELGCYGVPVRSPNIDALAAAGVRFDHAYCQYPLCNPSRTSILTGRQPDRTGVFDNSLHFRQAHPEWVTLPQYFKNNGYVTAYSGKIFHGGLEDPASWSEAGGGAAGAAPSRRMNKAGKQGVPAKRQRDPKEYARVSDRIVVLEGNEESHSEWRIASNAISLLEKHKDEAFFIGCGFLKPHSAPTAPKRFFDLYDPAGIQLPPNFAPRPTVPPGFPEASLVPNYDLFIKRNATPEAAREMIRAYWASISWMDFNLGRVMAALDRLGLRERTIIVFWGDNGYHLGEMGKWAKHGSLYEEGARIPLIVVVPGAGGNGRPCVRMVQSLDIYPTLVELCGLPMPQGLEGHSLVPLLSDPKAAWNYPAYSVCGNARTPARAVRTDRWRYAEWQGPKGGSMLIDMQNDPVETKNIAGDPAQAKTVEEMKALLKQLTEPR